MKKRLIILVTGATSGIGLQTAILLAAKGHQVIATGRSLDKLGRLRQAGNKYEKNLCFATVDLADPDSIDQLQRQVLELTDGYGVDVLVNNAGYAEGGALEEIPLTKLRMQFETNVIGFVGVTQAMLPMMRKRRSGRIINISSVLGKVSLPLMGAYCASKHAVEALSDALRMELKHSGIQVSILAPGSIQTEFGYTLSHSLDEWMDPNSPYYNAYQVMRVARQADRGANPIVIAKAICKAINARRMKPRYALPFDSKAMPVIRAILPTRTLDYLIRWFVLGRQA